jgi:DNA helicase-2/ATP-dependent DNA helicase PcrA
LPRDFVIYDSADQLSAVKQVLRDLQIDENAIQPRAALSRISHAKNRMETPANMASAQFDFRAAQMAKVFEGYLAALRTAGALDFDDLLLKTVELFEKAVDVRMRYSQRFRFVMVDEYQDTNRPQYMLMRRLAEVHRNLAVVGDPDQSIYGWRGADIRNILDFEHDFPNAKTVRLEQNYRSTEVILDAASAVISNNRNRKEKVLRTDLKGGELITYSRCSDELEEADVIARAAREALAADRDVSAAVLYRTNSQSRVIEDALRRESLAYRIIGGVRFYERKEVKDAISYLKVLLNPHDNVSVRRVINVPTRGIGKVVMDSLEALRVESDLGPAETSAMPLLSDDDRPEAGSLWTIINRGLEARRFPNRSASALAVFRDLIYSLRGIATLEPVSLVIGKVLDQSGYLRDLREDRSEESASRIENLAELVSAAREYESRDPEASLAGFVDKVSLLADADESDGAESARILLMTLHSAKGLEFPVVFIAGLEEGLFPHSRATNADDDMEEERRLFYVGVTRAQTKLFLSSACRRRVFGEYRAAEPSQFLDEVPERLLKKYDFATASSRGAAYRSGGSVDPYARRPLSGNGRSQGWGGSNAAAPKQVRESEPSYAYEDEDQSDSALRLGMRVRHPQFGIGTILGIEGDGEDAKLTVRFASAGSKKLLARYAKLERA